MAKKFTWHRNPAERTFLEKVARLFIFPDYTNPLFNGLNFGSWEKRDRRRKRTFPVRWFISETIPSFYHTTRRGYYDVKDWFRWRVYDRYHVIKTDLKPGYYDKDEIMLQANFKLLKDYVEIELPVMQGYGEDDENAATLNKWRKFKSKIRQIIRVHSHERNPVLGLRYLEEEIQDPYIQGTIQAANAMEKLELYKWWTIIRPAREDVWETPLIWTDPDDALRVSSNNTDEYALMSKLEEFYEAEDQEMLIRLIKIRKSLWT